MATGDNVLTAISVARQCHIIDDQIEVWLADLKSSDDGEPQIEWKSTKSDKVETSIPFNFEDKSIEVALTGKAFRYLVE